MPAINRAMTLDDLFQTSPEPATETSVGAVRPRQVVPSSERASEVEAAAELTPDDLLVLDRMNSAVLALGRRVVARPSSDLLAQDALKLLVESFGLDCGLIAESLPGCAGLVVRALVSKDGSAGPNLGDTLCEGSLAGLAFETGQIQVSSTLPVEAVRKDATLRQWKVASAIAMSLRLVGENIGALVICSCRERNFTRQELAAVEAVSALLASALAYNRAAERLQRYASFNSTLRATTTQLTVVVDDQGKILEINRLCLESTAFREHDLLGRPFFEALCAPADLAIAQSQLAQVKPGTKVIQFESRLLSKTGTEQQIAWSLYPTQHPSATGPCVLMIGRLALPTDQASPPTAAVSLLTAPQPDSTPTTAAERKSEPIVGLVPAISAPPAATVKGGREMRTSERKSFPFFQRLAPYRDREPTAGEYFMARFRDISAGGLSFIAAEKPLYPAVMVELGTRTEPKKMIATVMRVEPVLEDAKPAFLVCCKFLRRA